MTENPQKRGMDTQMGLLAALLALSIKCCILLRHLGGSKFRRAHGRGTYYMFQFEAEVPDPLKSRPEMPHCAATLSCHVVSMLRVAARREPARTHVVETLISTASTTMISCQNWFVVDVVECFSCGLDYHCARMSQNRLSPGGVRTPVVGVLFSVFITEHALNRSPVKIQIHHIGRSERFWGQGGREQLVEVVHAARVGG